MVATGGDFTAVLKGAAGSAVLGGIGGHYGDTWTMGRVGLNTVANGAIVDWNGGSFSDGAKAGFATSIARYSYNKLSGYDMEVEMEDETNEPDGNNVEKMRGPIYVSKSGSTFGTNTPLNQNVTFGMFSFTCENYWR